MVEKADPNRAQPMPWAYDAKETTYGNKPRPPHPRLPREVPKIETGEKHTVGAQ